ncbi:leucine rich repeat containing 51 [Corythoichthys intestinalis]|uniref:leucine rich repeat containing 51 n=1 Tax=Corythoichthys intestinalis TaxID=161448 RepID=UPI0025A4D4F7|nr:leucine rich repeat containing 51 [Corythoichthys intestinalis]XP_057694615.1 leucine rich repeat containing 51 [Corythoichthys intestinalis]XP_061797841.1 leucine-rich repeat-containing protein 51-like [Nerophis lumbriciformis]
MMYGAPVDLSFKDISNLADALSEEPSSGLRPMRRNSLGKFQSGSLRLNNNHITNLYDLHKTISHFLAKPSLLAWLDLSFNRITNIDKVLCELPQLRVLYLHGNRIFTLSEVDKLQSLSHLHTITLHGNMIETNKAYRNHVISALPRIKTMDFSVVTPQERDLAQIWHKSSPGKRIKETLK